MRTLLVANRGEIARRIFRTAHAMGVSTVSVFTEHDGSMPFVREADVAVRVPSYLDVDAIVAAARVSGVDAIHPGYGFLSENAGFARACLDAGLVFVGPPPDVIATMGSKVEAKALMAAAGVPVLGSSRDAFPLIVKASAGGGGRGMRIVRDAAALEAAMAEASAEAASSFGDGTVFVERYVEAPRHVEVQIVGDVHGQVIHLFERECSIQRRHQKVIEESPSVAVDDRLRAELCAAAVAAGKAVGYVGAGTVEFLLEPDGSFWFLEMNTRLQVEHPVTEMVTGLDLVRLQLEVARGERLELAPSMSGHAIEARLYAEDVSGGYLPVAGRLARFRVPGPGCGVVGSLGGDPGGAVPTCSDTLRSVSEVARVRVDAGVEDGSEVGVHYDAMLAKVIAHAPTRAEAVATLERALRTARIHGITTNRDLLVAVLRCDDFLDGLTDTHLLERFETPPPNPDVERVHASVAAQAARARRRVRARVLGGLPSGWRNNPSQPQVAVYEGRTGRIEVAYTAPLDCTDELVVLEADGVRRTYEVHLDGDTAYVDGPDGSSALREVERFPPPDAGRPSGSLVAPLPGVVVRVEVSAGDEVDAGATLLVLEAMKMQHPVVAPSGGVVKEVCVQEGEQVASGAVLAVVE